jgi:hypothetical protein
MRDAIRVNGPRGRSAAIVGFEEYADSRVDGGRGSWKLVV